MILITERPSLNKIKMFFCSGDCPSFIANLKINRGIPDNDLNVYKVTDGTKFLCDAYKYSVDVGVITVYETHEVDVSKSHYKHWCYMDTSTIESLYTPDEVVKINSLISQYSRGTLEAMVKGSIPFPSGFSFFDGVYVDIPPKPVAYVQKEYVDVPCQVINVEAI